jgi:hypothetical protein
MIATGRSCWKTKVAWREIVMADGLVLGCKRGTGGGVVEATDQPGCRDERLVGELGVEF